MTVTIYHNPRCNTSRQTLALLEKQGIKPRIVEYLKTPPSAAELKRLLAKLGLNPRQLLRKKEAKEAGLDKPDLSDAQLIAGSSWPGPPTASGEPREQRHASP